MAENRDERPGHRQLGFTQPKDLRDRTGESTREVLSVGRGPLLSRQRLGDELRRLRKEQQLSQNELGSIVGASGARISRLETADVVPDLALVMKILDQLPMPQHLKDSLIRLAREANEQTWWQTKGMPARQGTFAEVEALAHTIREYSVMFVPGLLQTPAYVEARYADREATLPFDEAAASRGRGTRQQILTRPDDPVVYKVVLDEAVIRRRSAPRDALGQQFGYLSQVAQLPNVELRVLPFDAAVDFCSPPLNSFSLYDTTEPARMVLVETETSELQLTNPDEIERYAVLFDRITTAALTPDESVELIKGAHPS